jgi:hypothetical protein
MLLNNLDQNFVIALDYNWFYPDVTQKWMPILERLWLPYVTLEDFFNSQITSINFPGFSSSNMQQQGRLYKIQKRPAVQEDMVIDKTLTLTVKATESYISYFVARHQYQLFLRLGQLTPLYMPNITVALLDDGGFETVSYCYQQLTPTSIGDLSMSYAARLGQFNTFTWTFTYNYYDVYIRNGKGERELISKEYDPYKDGNTEYLDLDKPKYKQKDNPGFSSKQKLNQLHSISKFKPNEIGIILPKK